VGHIKLSGVVLRVDDHLRETRPVAQVHEYQTSMVAAAVDPTLQNHLVVDVIRPQFSTSVRSRIDVQVTHGFTSFCMSESLRVIGMALRGGQEPCGNLDFAGSAPTGRCQY
jgi:hypothetical protein